MCSKSSKINENGHRKIAVIVMANYKTIKIYLCVYTNS